ncbi:MAG: hypothetical protein SGCHY_002858 [Lobulomycetales sp.]
MASIGDKLAEAAKRKESGNEAFKAGDHPTALRRYHETLLYCTGLDTSQLSAVLGDSADTSASPQPSTQQAADIKALQISVHANMALIHVASGNHSRAVESCSKCLALDPSHAKALFRRGQAYVELGQLDKAESDLRAAVRVCPSDPGIRSLLEEVLARQKTREVEAGSMYKGMFDKK